MLASVLSRSLAAVAFVVFGIVWSSSRSSTLAVLWVISFVALVFAALWYDMPPENRPRLSAAWYRVPGSSKNPDDYR